VIEKHKLIFFPEEGYLKGFFEKTKDMSPEERGRYLEEDEVSVQHCRIMEWE